ncbi:MAG TPA: hypothetical protein VFH45_05195 [Acidimicrobiales bacterium]|nr:hypothetical protein [Acidimicrobiales bacterium]
MSRLLHRVKRRGGEAGFSVLELVIAASILLIVLAVFGNTMISLGNTEVRSQALVANEQNTRFVLDQLTREIRAANPLVALGSLSSYSNSLELELGPVGGSQKVVRWLYDTTTGSPTYKELVRQVMSDATTSATVVSQAVVLTSVRNAESSTPVFTYYGQSGDDLVGSGSFTAADVANCAVQVHITIVANPNPGPQPFTANTDAEIRNRLPGGVGCG